MTGSAPPDAAAPTHEARVKRAIWRASHRGTKEMDIMIGRFAEARVPVMAEDQLTRFELLLQLPDPDLQRWLIDPAEGDGDTVRQEYATELAAIRRFHDLRA